MTYLEVAVAAPLEQSLTYALVSEESDGYIDFTSGAEEIIGRRVLVPLTNRRVTGYVIGLSKEQEKKGYAIRKIVKYLDSHPLFHPEIVPFYQWIAQYYHYPIGLVIKAALPGGLAIKSINILELLTTKDELYSFFKAEIPVWVKKLAENKKLTQTETTNLIKNPKVKNVISRLRKNKIVQLVATIQKDGVGERNEVCYAVSDDVQMVPRYGEFDDKIEIKKFQKMFKEKNGSTLKLSEAKAVYVLDQLTTAHKHKYIALKDIRKKYSSVAKPLKSLSERGLVVKVRERVFRTPFGDPLPYYPPPAQLSDDQIDVLRELKSAIRIQKYGPFLLHGVTGSGKTEVYLKAAEETLRLGRDVLVLVPEIGLATALEAHFTSRFGKMVALMHSGMTRATRFDQFSLALTGKARVVIGARSAIFAPLKDPGLIVVDEEHDQGFKQDDSFRYNGRDLAIVRAKNQNSVVVLGSATPAVTSYANAAAGKYQLLSMANRIGNNVMPQVQLIDLNSAESKKDKSIIKNNLRSKIESNIEAGKQTILLINRRGFSTALLCRDCGSPVQCNHCHVSLTYHLQKKRLICHYCGFSIKQEIPCAECRSTDLAAAGIGIERVEEEVRDFFPQAAVRRLDSDTAADRKKLHLILKEMHTGEIDILIGTQMVAKGHHFPNVTLVGIVWADGGMNMPDFRAAERTFQLITQVTGRAGRGLFPGEVIIQTMRPDHYSITFAKNHSYIKLFEREMKLRKVPSFPPYVRLTAIHLKGPVENMVRKSALEVARFCRKMITSYRLDIVVLGPAPSPLDKIKDNYRWQLLLKGKTSEMLQKMCNILKKKQMDLVPRSCVLIIDVDPENLM